MDAADLIRSALARPAARSGSACGCSNLRHADGIPQPLQTAQCIQQHRHAQA